MRILTFFITFLISACTSMPEEQIKIHESDNKHTAGYDELIHAIKTKPMLTEITKLRQAVVITDRHKENVTFEQSQNQLLFQAIEAENWSECLQIVNEGLALNYASLNNHYGGLVCYLESANTVQSQYHESVLNLILEAIWQTGDGQSFETAFQVINQTEQNTFIEFHGLESIKQLITERDGQQFTIVTIYDAQKDKTFEWYFALPR